MVATIPLAAVLFLPGPGSAGAADPWLQGALAALLSLPLAALGGRFHAVVRALSESLQREHRLLESERAARTDAERANRVRDEFLAVLSHELRSPLNAIVGWAHILKTQGETPDGRAVETILRNAEHQVRLLSDISDLSRVATGKLVLEALPVDVRSTLDQTMDAVRLSADARGVRLQMVVADRPLVVLGEADRLRQVLWNLLSNAIKFTPSSGLVRAEAFREGDAVVVTVSDTGQGIGSEFLPHVFDTFRQEDASKTRRQGGLGLGLAIVRHVVQAHGGSVVVRSDGAGRGTTFTVSLPAHLGSTPTTTTALDLSQPQLAGLRILIVDDDGDTRGLLARALSDLGADVVSAPSTAEARVEISRRIPDAIVSDIGMPEEDGLTFIRSLKGHKAHRSIPAVALTAYASESDRAEALAAGFFEHVSKPVPPYHLARVIVASLRRPS
jgi:signal transduction histidine kinase/CheY-like chemotaxis protein